MLPHISYCHTVASLTSGRCKSKKNRKKSVHLQHNISYNITHQLLSATTCHGWIVISLLTSSALLILEPKHRAELLAMQRFTLEIKGWLWYHYSRILYLEIKLVTQTCTFYVII